MSEGPIDHRLAGFGELALPPFLVTPAAGSTILLPRPPEGWTLVLFAISYQVLGGSTPPPIHNVKIDLVRLQDDGTAPLAAASPSYILLNEPARLFWLYSDGYSGLPLPRTGGNGLVWCPRVNTQDLTESTKDFRCYFGYRPIDSGYPQPRGWC